MGFANWKIEYCLRCAYLTSKHISRLPKLIGQSCINLLETPQKLNYESYIRCTLIHEKSQISRCSGCFPMSRQLWCWKLAQGTVIVVFFGLFTILWDGWPQAHQSGNYPLCSPHLRSSYACKGKKARLENPKELEHVAIWESLYTWPEKCLVWKKLSWLRISGEKLLALKTSRTSHEKWCCFAFCKVFISDVPRLLDLKSIDIWWKCTKAEQIFLMYDGKSESNRW